jgi:hypothetical protein
MKLLPLYFGSGRRKRQHHSYPFGGCLNDHHDALNHIFGPSPLVTCSHQAEPRAMAGARGHCHQQADNKTLTGRSSNQTMRGALNIATFDLRLSPP